MSIAFAGSNLDINGHSVKLPWPVLQAMEHQGKVFVLLDPDAYLTSPGYGKEEPALRNLWAFDLAGHKIWEAELPQDSDYYYRLTSANPLVANSFSSHICTIDSGNGAVLQAQFVK
jgi:hypothetical protein